MTLAGASVATAAFLNGTDAALRARLHATRFVANRVYLIASNAPNNDGLKPDNAGTFPTAILTSIFTPPVCCLHTTVLTE